MFGVLKTHSPTFFFSGFTSPSSNFFRGGVDHIPHLVFFRVLTKNRMCPLYSTPITSDPRTRRGLEIFKGGEMSGRPNRVGFGASGFARSDDTISVCAASRYWVHPPQVEERTFTPQGEPQAHLASLSIKASSQAELFIRIWSTESGGSRLFKALGF